MKVSSFSLKSFTGSYIRGLVRVFKVLGEYFLRILSTFSIQQIFKNNAHIISNLQNNNALCIRVFEFPTLIAFLDIELVCKRCFIRHNCILY